MLSCIYLLGGAALLLCSQLALGEVLSVLILEQAKSYALNVGQKNFPSESDITNAARSLENRVPYSSSNGWRVYPQLFFPCTTSINGLTVIGYTGSKITMEVKLWRPAENRLDHEPQPPTPNPNGRMCREYHELASTTALSIDRSSSSSVPGFDRVSFGVNVESVPRGTILSIMHIAGTILYQKRSAGPSEQPAAEDVCIPGTNSANDDFPLIYVETGKEETG